MVVLILVGGLIVLFAVHPWQSNKPTKSASVGKRDPLPKNLCGFIGVDVLRSFTLILDDVQPKPTDMIFGLKLGCAVRAKPGTRPSVVGSISVNRLQKSLDETVVEAAARQTRTSCTDQEEETRSDDAKHMVEVPKDLAVRVSCIQVDDEPDGFESSSDVSIDLADGPDMIRISYYVDPGGSGSHPEKFGIEFARKLLPKLRK